MKTHQQFGFSLIELMIAVAIVGVLASIAYPSYSQYMKSSRRADAMGELQQAAGNMERYFTINGNYTGATAGTTIPNRIPANGTKLYDVTLTLTPAGTPKTGFTITATPTSGKSQADDGKIEISHTGAKRWDEKNDGFGSDDNDWAKN